MVIDHGNWILYTPATPKSELAPHNILYARRDSSEGEDWYEYRASKPFGDTSVIMTVESFETGDMVQQATFNPDQIFPARMRLIEETEYTGNDPFNDFHGLIYDPPARKIGPDKWKPPNTLSPFEMRVLGMFEAIIARIDKLEQKG